MITNNSLGNQYNVQGLDRAVLSRTISDVATIQQPLLPWGPSGVFVHQCFEVPVSQFAGYYFYGMATPVFGLLYALTGIGCFRTVSTHEAPCSDGSKQGE